MTARNSWYFNAFREALGKGFGDVLRTEKIVNLRLCSGKTHPRTACGTDILIVCFVMFAVAKLSCIQDLVRGGVC